MGNKKSTVRSQPIDQKKPNEDPKTSVAVNASTTTPTSSVTFAPRENEDVKLDNMESRLIQLACHTILLRREAIQQALDAGDKAAIHVNVTRIGDECIEEFRFCLASSPEGQAMIADGYTVFAHFGVENIHVSCSHYQSPQTLIKPLELIIPWQQLLVESIGTK